MPKYSFLAPATKNPFNHHGHKHETKCTDPNPRCGDCLHKPAMSEICSLKNKVVKDYNKCEFFKRDVWSNV